MIVRVLAHIDHQWSFVGTGFRPRGDNFAITCQHVVDGFDELAVAGPRRTTPVEVYEADKANDIAVVAARDGAQMPSVQQLPVQTTLSPPVTADTVGWGSDQRRRSGRIVAKQDGALHATFTCAPGDSGSPVIVNEAVVGIVRRPHRFDGWASARAGDSLTTYLERYTDTQWLQQLSDWFAVEARGKTAAVPLTALDNFEAISVDSDGLLNGAEKQPQVYA